MGTLLEASLGLGCHMSSLRFSSFSSAVERTAFLGLDPRFCSVYLFSPWAPFCLLLALTLRLSVERSTGIQPQELRWIYTVLGIDALISVETGGSIPRRLQSVDYNSTVHAT